MKTDKCQFKRNVTKLLPLFCPTAKETETYCYCVFRQWHEDTKGGELTMFQLDQKLCTFPWITLYRDKGKKKHWREIRERTDVPGKFWVESEASLWWFSDNRHVHLLCSCNFTKNWSIWWVLSLVTGWTEHVPLLASIQLTPAQVAHWMSGSNSPATNWCKSWLFVSTHLLRKFFKEAFKGWWHIVFPTFLFFCLLNTIPEDAGHKLWTQHWSIVTFQVDGCFVTGQQATASPIFAPLLALFWSPPSPGENILPFSC